MKQRSCAASIKVLLSSMVQESKSSAFSDVAVKEQDLKTDQKEVGRLVHLQGYAYLNALFLRGTAANW